MSSPSALERCRLQLPILKVRPGAVVEAVFYDVGPLWFGVHWAGGRQQLCVSDVSRECPLCCFGGSRVVGMCLVSCRLQGGSQAFLLEISPLGWSNFETRLRFAGLDLLTGVLTQISRPRAKGALRVEALRDGAGGEGWLDAERRLLGGWAVLYGLPLPTLDETMEAFTTRVSSVVEARARLAVAQLKA